MDIQEQKKPFIIAEMSGNHNHPLERLRKVVEMVAIEVGANTVKLQTHTADTMTIDGRGGGSSSVMKIISGAGGRLRFGGYKWFTYP